MTPTDLPRREPETVYRAHAEQDRIPVESSNLRTYAQPVVEPVFSAQTQDGPGIAAIQRYHVRRTLDDAVPQPHIPADSLATRA